ncbi:MAG: glycosyltransferase [Furfurilactobacillus sp.]|jgi:glycosyltransferase involved in cell wall biosynthesis|uniref:glycosyltransferase family 2 protein n=1 Tax=Furfurilactobacillus sp. TaxID=2767911 RepID=UPI00258A1E03|nr:glycosyltransferase family 2 protein [Furfurilactobacillus sp.]MCH4012059.1 glycosyltransferase [Furfurilactobacillus sp.]MCH4037951.1 glycosyltransferase [Furfurilactobacillus sp.]MCH4115412.1 glycosyltransferase [Furfurilactobacillus sp.]MCI1341029.1 glycosyltransferase [Furfurilactobacillus sp.]MCI1387893.1 glycosyltransferase [Furfurilactobacillus sp.]
MSEQKQPAITAVVTVYNLRNYLDPCLVSLARQTLSNFEVIMVDDHSTDGSNSVIEKWAQKDSRFIAAHLPEHSGVSAARNYGIDHASAPVICFVDGDDLCEPNYLQTFVDGMSQPGVDLVTVGYRWGGYARGAVSGITGWHKISQDDMLSEATEHGTQIGGYTWNKAFRVSVINRLMLRFDTHLKLAEDLQFTADYEAGAQRFLFNPTLVYNKVSRPGSTIHTASMAMRRGEMEVDAHIDQLRENLNAG